MPKRRAQGESHAARRVYMLISYGMHKQDLPSPDAALIATGASDHNIYVFNADDGSLYDTLVGHTTIVTAVAFSPDGRTLASTAGGPLLSESLNPISVGPDDFVHLWSRN